MPHAVFDTGSISATSDSLSRTLVPGVEPGGSRVGQPLKPAVLLQDAHMEVLEFDTATEDFNSARLFLKMSKNNNLNPGLNLLVGSVHSSAVGATNPNALYVEQNFKAKGTIWAAAYLGVRMVETGSLTVRARIHLDYERVDIPWMEWFMRWEYLDNIVDNTLEF